MPVLAHVEVVSGPNELEPRPAIGSMVDEVAEDVVHGLVDDRVRRLDLEGPVQGSAPHHTSHRRTVRDAGAVPDRCERAPEVAWRRTSRHVVATTTRGTVTVGELGAVVWDAVREPVELEVLAAELAEAFGVPRPDARARLDSVVAELEASGLVRVR
jgi:hypothetical protein